MKYIKLIRSALFLSVAGCILSSCNKEQQVTENVIYDNIIYEIDTVNLYQSNLKTIFILIAVNFIQMPHVKLFQARDMMEYHL